MTTAPLGNLFTDSEPPAQGERFETLLSHRNLVIERILSSARIEAVDYVQEQDEWVVLVRGQARMTVAGKAVELAAGDHLFLAAGTPHRVERTSDGALWLAVHLHPSSIP
ncbi:cupin [Pseudomonas daroniae]|uniref:Cupin n=1 Tax=Phytopseudomonas daroniae TaxID=2487519 RepID=A0A4Q9QII0_9GAMM|nr:MULTISPECIES: cupin domain-containing protein [Pseudomonas]TBU74343.1 cupin [Pseudomonas daroniae]TBU75994.1 cupin [Pseudomonas daroniae]TBU85473.1 cupin [Pseudomonas sp. FRB 228]TBU94321.1 cupin [Pseudomonas daroniae]